MDHKKFIGIRKEINNERQRIGFRSPFFILGFLFFLVLVVIGISRLAPLQQSITSITSLGSNQTYINSLASNSTKLATEIVNESTALASLWSLLYLAGITGLILAGYVIFIMVSNMAQLPANFKDIMMVKLKAKGYTEKEIDEYIKERHDENQWENI